MNVTMLAQFLHDVARDYETSSVIQNLEKYTKASNKTPARTARFDQLPGASDVRASVAALKAGEVATYGSVRRRRLDEIGLLQLTGVDLAKRIEEIVGQESAAQIVSSQLDGLRSHIVRASHDVLVVSQSLKALGIQEALPATNPEFLLRIPEPSGGWTVDSLHSALHEWDRQLQTFEEICTGRRSARKIARTSDGSIEFAITLSGLSEAVLLAIAITGIASLVLFRQKVRMARASLAELALPAHIPNDIDAHEQSVQKQQIADTVQKICGLIAIEDQGRLNELQNGVSAAVNFMHERASNGDSFETRVPQNVLAHAKRDSDSANQLLLPYEEAVRLLNESKRQVVETDIATHQSAAAQLTAGE